MPLLLTNGTVVDGTGGPACQADVLVDEGVIEALGQIPVPSEAQVLDCAGLVVAPGFVDVHSHSDIETLEHRPEKIAQGITTEVVGNCGFSNPNQPPRGIAYVLVNGQLAVQAGRVVGEPAGVPVRHGRPG